MGAAAMVGLGLAIAQPDRRVLVVTGDGEMLMGLGGLATIGVQHAIFNMPNVHDIRPLEIFGREIIPAVAGL